MSFDNQYPFGSPPPQRGFDNPYAPPTFDQASFDEFRAEPEGTYAGGFAAGFLAALVGLGLVYAFGKPETKRGALHGFFARLALVFVVVMLSALAA